MMYFQVFDVEFGVFGFILGVEKNQIGQEVVSLVGEESKLFDRLFLCFGFEQDFFFDVVDLVCGQYECIGWEIQIDSGLSFGLGELDDELFGIQLVCMLGCFVELGIDCREWQFEV